MNAVEITRVTNRILVKFPYSERDVQLVKSVGGGRWNATDKCWTFALSMETCTGLRNAFGNRLVIGDTLREWAWEEKRRRDELEAIRDGAIDIAPKFIRLPKHAPLLYERLRPYQLLGIAFGIAGGSVLIGDQPGLGKTYEALGIAVESGARRILVACPRTAVRTVWESHINELLPGCGAAYVAQGLREQRDRVIAEFDSAVRTDDTRFLICNMEMIRVKRVYLCMVDKHGDPTSFVIDGQPEYKSEPGSRGGCGQESAHGHRTMHYPEYPQLHATPWDLIIMDESHKALASTYNKQSKNITQIRLGAVRLPLSPGGRRLAVSATPNRSKANKAWGTLNWLRPDIFTSYWNWAGKYFTVSTDGYAGARTVTDRPNDPEQFRDAMRPYLLARTKAEAAPDLPPIEYAGTAHPLHPDVKGVWLEITREQAKAYSDMARLGSTILDGRKLTAVGVLAEITRRKQFANSLLVSRGGAWYPCMPSNKIDWILEFLEEREGFDGKVVIASQFTRFLYLLQDVIGEAGYHNMILTGETSDKGRSEFVQNFQDPEHPAKIGLINMKAGGESITLDAADDMILTDEPWTDDEIRQVEDRAHRVSRIHQVTVYRLRSLGTIDEDIALLTKEQRELIQSLRPEGRKLAEELLKGEVL